MDAWGEHTKDLGVVNDFTDVTSIKAKHRQQNATECWQL